MDRLLNVLSGFTLVMTVPQVLNAWKPHASGVSVLSWAAYLLAACLWFIHGIQKGDKSIYLPCIGWILLDATVIAGVIVQR